MEHEHNLLEHLWELAQEEETTSVTHWATQLPTIDSETQKIDLAQQLSAMPLNDFHDIVAELSSLLTQYLSSHTTLANLLEKPSLKTSQLIIQLSSQHHEIDRAFLRDESVPQQSIKLAWLMWHYLLAWKQLAADQPIQICFSEAIEGLTPAIKKSLKKIDEKLNQKKYRQLQSFSDFCSDAHDYSALALLNTKYKIRNIDAETPSRIVKAKLRGLSQHMNNEDPHVTRAVIELLDLETSPQLTAFSDLIIEVLCEASSQGLIDAKIQLAKIYQEKHQDYGLPQANKKSAQKLLDEAYEAGNKDQKLLAETFHRIHKQRTQEKLG